VRRLSILIPYWGRLTHLEETLVSVLQNRPEACEVVVVLNHPYDDPYQLAGEVTFVPAEPQLGLLGSVSRGLAACNTPLVHLLHCGMEVAPHWVESAMTHFDNEQVGAVATLIARRDTPSRLVSAGVDYCPAGKIRRRSAGQLATAGLSDKQGASSPDPLAGFFRRQVLERVVALADGMDPELGTGDLAAATALLGVECVVEPRCRTYAAPDLVSTESSFRAGAADERLFWRWAAQHPRTNALLGHLGLHTEELLRAVIRPTLVPRLVGRTLGGLQWSTVRRQRRAVEAWCSAQQSTTAEPTDADAFSFASSASAEAIWSSSPFSSLGSSACLRAPASC